MQIQQGPIKGKEIFRTSDGIQGGYCNMLNYPMELCVTQAAANAICNAYQLESMNSTIHVSVVKQCGAKLTLCSINTNLFGSIMRFKEVFLEPNKAAMMRSAHAIHTTFMEQVRSFSVMGTKKNVYDCGYLSTREFNFEDYKSKLSPRVECNTSQQLCLTFPVGGFQISDTKDSLFSSLYMDRSLLSASTAPCVHRGNESIIAFSAEYVLGEFGIDERHPIPNKFVHVSELPELLRIEMDYKEGKWELVAIQRGI